MKMYIYKLNVIAKIIQFLLKELYLKKYFTGINMKIVLKKYKDKVYTNNTTAEVWIEVYDVLSNLKIQCNIDTIIWNKLHIKNSNIHEFKGKYK